MYSLFIDLTQLMRGKDKIRYNKYFLIALSVFMPMYTLCACVRVCIHASNMSDNRYPKKLLFGWLPQKHPAYGVKLNWRDKI